MLSEHIEKQKASERLLADEIEKRRDCESEKGRLSAEVQRLTRRVEEGERSTFSSVVKVLADRWRSAEVASPREARSLDDPVYGRISLDEKLSTIFAHPLVQRLNRVRQLSFSYAQFPSATHTRLSHCLGTAKNAELALSGMLDRGVYYVEGEDAPRRFDRAILDRRNQIVQKAKLAALLHDLGHGPFGHALDDYAAFGDINSVQPMPDKIYTTQYIRKFLAPTLRAVGFDPEEIATVLELDQYKVVRGIDHLIADVINSSLDVDRMDYLVRDANMTGLTMGFVNTMALIDSMRPVMDDDAFILTYDEAAIRYMEHFLYARDAMYLNCYEAARKRAAERIFRRLIKELNEDQSLGLDVGDLLVLTDEEVMTVLRGIGAGSETRREVAEKLLRDVAYEAVHEVAFNSENATPDVRNWHDSLIKGRTGGIGYLHVAYVSKPEEWEKLIAAEAGTDVWNVQVIVPSYHHYPQKQSATKILTKDDDDRFKTVDLFSKSEVIKEVLRHSNPLRNRVRVVCPDYLSRQERKRVKDAAMQLLGS